MALSAGDKLGPYEILERVGAGGMGEVYKARDTRLDRNVAVKVSSEKFSERFQREAQAIASFNHPHICTLHDVGPDYLVMEYIEGAQLKGPLPIGEVLRLATQIADALSEAHRHGVIHRDLKPGNILVTKAGAKVLDFGLAKMTRTAQAPSTLATTLTQHGLTQEGTILGTPQYMAPEQLEGQEADRRTDIFAFGLVLYEMIAGRPAFDGKTQANLIASILAAEPQSISTLQPLVPPALDHLIKTCLAKDPDDRQQNMHDVLLELKWIAESGSQAGIPKPVVERRKRRERLSWTLAAVMSTAALALAFVHFRQEPPEVTRMQFEIPPPAKVSFRSFDLPVISPDGRKLAFTGMLDGKARLWIRRMDSLQMNPLPGTEEAFIPFWSPDSRFLGFFADGQLKKIDVNGGPPLTLCAASATGAWSRDGVIIFRSGSGALSQISAAGGEPKPLLKLEGSRKERYQSWPDFLPDGRHFIYTSSTEEQGKGGIYLSSLDSKESRLLFAADANAIFAPPGFLLFGRVQVLMAHRFDLAKLRVRGDSFPIAESVANSSSNLTTSFSSSQNGVLVYRPQISGNFRLSGMAEAGIG